MSASDEMSDDNDPVIIAHAYIQICDESGQLAKAVAAPLGAESALIVLLYPDGRARIIANSSPAASDAAQGTITRLGELCEAHLRPKQ